MPVQPKPFSLICPKCGFSKVVQPKSDVVEPLEMVSLCSKCDFLMEKKKLDFFDSVKSIFKHKKLD